jgi:Zn-dependent protease
VTDLGTALVYYVVFLFSTTVHEAGHAWAAKLGGDLTAYHGGQVTLDPRPHVKREPFGMVILPLLSVVLSGWPLGYASAPYDPRWALRYPRRAAWMALAGPGANLALMVAAALLLRLGGAVGLFYTPPSIRFDHLAGTDGGGAWAAAVLLLSVFFSLNLVLLCLNLIPLPPLDGSAAVPLLLSEPTAARYQQFLLGSGRTFALIGMLAAWKLFDVIFHPLFLLAVNLLYPGAHYG